MIRHELEIGVFFRDVFRFDRFHRGDANHEGGVRSHGGARVEKIARLKVGDELGGALPSEFGAGEREPAAVFNRDEADIRAFSDFPGPLNFLGIISERPIALGGPFVEDTIFHVDVVTEDFLSDGTIEFATWTHFKSPFDEWIWAKRPGSYPD